MTNIELDSKASLEQGFRSEKTVYLNDFPTGATGTIVTMNLENELQGRLMGLGLFIGTHFRLLQGGNRSRKPLLLAVGETRIVLGPEIGRTILVEK